MLRRELYLQKVLQLSNWVKYLRQGLPFWPARSSHCLKRKVKTRVLLARTKTSQPWAI